MGKLGLGAKAAVARIKLIKYRAGNFIHKGQRQLSAAAGERLIVLDGGHDARGRFKRLITALTPNLSHGSEHPPEAGPPIAVVGRKIRTAKVGPPVGREEGRQRPAALPADG